MAQTATAQLSSDCPAQNDAQEKGVVFNIQRFTIHDGPGIRTELFLKGCNLRCRWCGNPEGFLLGRQVGILDKCIGVEQCGQCLKACPRATEQALVVKEGKITDIRRDICDNCMRCTDVCSSGALKSWGNELSVDEAMETILRDVDFYRQSGGGVTISGGESLYQWKFTKAVLQRCQQEGIHTCLETALAIKPDIVMEVLPYADMVITDIKHMDSAIHEQHTGVGNELVLENIQYIARIGTPMVLRIPIIPGVNDDLDNIDRTADFILDALEKKPLQLQLLRFRRLGEEKYRSLSLPYPMGKTDPERSVFEQKIESFAQRLRDRGIPAVAGTTSKIPM